MMIYGGNQDKKKIAQINGCDLVDTGKRLINDFTSVHGALVTVPEVHEETILCEGNNGKSCESFDGTTSLAISETKEQHRFSCMALYNFQAFVIAGDLTSGTEVLSFSGWQSEAEHSEGTLTRFSCASIDGGVLTIGGYKSGFMKTVYLFKNEKWTLVGELKNNSYFGAMMMFGDYFIAFDGISENQVERAEWNGTHVTSSQTLSSQEVGCYRPIIFESEPDQCSEFCSNDFCYV